MPAGAGRLHPCVQEGRDHDQRFCGAKPSGAGLRRRGEHNPELRVERGGHDGSSRAAPVDVQQRGKRIRLRRVALEAQVEQPPSLHQGFATSHRDTKVPKDGAYPRRKDLEPSSGISSRIIIVNTN